LTEAGWFDGEFRVQYLLAAFSLVLIIAVLNAKEYRSASK
jgi:hypothetical protein